MKKWILGLISLGLTGLIIFSATRSQSTHIEEGGAVATFINEIFFASRLTQSELSNLISGFGAKFLGHFCLFLADGLFIYLFLNQFKIKELYKGIAIIVFGLFLASLGEIVELFVAERNSSYSDVIINFSGFIFTYLVLKLSKIPKNI